MQEDWSGEAHPQFVTCLTLDSIWIEFDLEEVTAILWKDDRNNLANLVLSNSLVISVTYPKTKEWFQAAWRSAKRNRRYGR